jgi:hypothetical protein
MGVTGESRTVVCKQGYHGGGTITCRSTNEFDTVTCDASACDVYQVPNSNFLASGSITGTYCFSLRLSNKTYTISRQCVT